MATAGENDVISPSRKRPHVAVKSSVDINADREVAGIMQPSIPKIQLPSRVCNYSLSISVWVGGHYTLNFLLLERTVTLLNHYVSVVLKSPV